MKKIVLTHGLVAGLILVLMFAITLPLTLNGRLDMGVSEITGYSSMLVAFIAIFLGIRAYREKLGGAITFGSAFKTGLLITLVISAIYVVSWEIVYWGFLPDFGDKYAALHIAKLQSEGAGAEAIAKAQADMARFKELYRNPLFNVGITFAEVFPLGFVVTLISAAILRRKAAGEPPAAAAA